MSVEVFESYVTIYHELLLKAVQRVDRDFKVQNVVPVTDCSKVI